jgi:amidase
MEEKPMDFTTGIGVFQIEEAAITQIQNALQSNQITCVELVQMYLDRIHAYDKNGPKLNSVLTINPDVFKIAEEMDQFLKKENKAYFSEFLFY